MTLKERLEAVWNENSIACPCHIVKWNEENEGYTKFDNYGLWFKKGKIFTPKRVKIKGKGFSWICRNYGTISRFRARQSDIKRL